LDGEVIEDIRDFLRWKMGWGPLGQGCGIAAAVLTLTADFFFVFLAAGLVAAVDFGLGFLGPAIFLVAVILGCEGASLTG
jgi:hypothetical protein